MHLLRHTLFFFFLLRILGAGAQGHPGLTNKIDSVVQYAIENQAFPGCVVYAKRGDRLLIHKSYGYHTYDSLIRVQADHLYDLASITKVAAGTLALMKLFDDGLIDLDAPIKKYVTKLGSKVGGISMREALAHQGGLQAWIPYYQEVLRKNGSYKGRTLSRTQRDGFSPKIADSLYMHDLFYDRIKKMIRRSDVSSDKKYQYSGLFFYLIPELVEQVAGVSFDQYLSQHFYEPLETSTLGFQPLNRRLLSEIVPTEIDTFFRNETIHGYVHDEGAILMQGISANAGLFSSASDLARIFEMLLDHGMYDSLQLLSPQTIELFTATQYPNLGNRRALGFDKPLLVYDANRSSVAAAASYRSFGHTGFTGTIAWADPAHDLIFIFLTNRVYPSRSNKKIYQMNIRPTIHQMVYDSLE